MASKPFTQTKVLLPLLLLAGAAAVAIGLWLSYSPIRATASPTRIFLVPEQVSPQTALLGTQKDLEVRGIRLVRTFDDLRQSVGPQTLSILIDRDLFATVDKQWLVQQYLAGRVIVGINVNWSDLTKALPPATNPLGQPIPLGPFPDYPHDRAHYSMIVAGAVAGKGCGGAAVDWFNEDLNLLFPRLEQKENCAKELLGITS